MAYLLSWEFCVKNLYFIDVNDEPFLSNYQYVMYEFQRSLYTCILNLSDVRYHMTVKRLEHVQVNVRLFLKRNVY